MRKLLLAAAATFAIAAPANAETTGSLGASFSNNEYDNGFDYDVWDVEGSVFHRISGPWAVQAEGRYEQADYGSGSDDDGHHLAIHGLFAAEGWTAGLLAGEGELFDDLEVDFYGAEGALRFGDWTLAGSILQGDIGTDYDRHRVGAKYFFGDNFAVGGNFAYTELGVSDWNTYDIGGEWRFGSLPITLTAGYLLMDADFSEIDEWRLGARWEFGTSNLRESDRTAPIADITQYFGDLRRWD